MNVYYIFLEGKPFESNDESKEAAGAYINCWVKSTDEASAKCEAIKYLHDVEGWQVLNIEEIYIAKQAWYKKEPESLKCFNQAVDCGIGVIFYIWPIGCEDENDNPASSLLH